MQTNSQLASAILHSVLLQEAQLREAGVAPEARLVAMQPGLEAMLDAHERNILRIADEAGRALAEALNRVGGPL